jgi:hypothetical protein
MKILFLFAIVAASLSVTVAHAECPLLMQKRLLLSDRAQQPSQSDQSPDSSVHSKKNNAVNAVNIGH